MDNSRLIAITFPSEEAAKTVLKTLNEVIDIFGMAALGDFKDLVGTVTTHEDYKVGWVEKIEADIRQVGEGEYLLNLPDTVPLI